MMVIWTSLNGIATKKDPAKFWIIWLNLSISAHTPCKLKSTCFLKEEGKKKQTSAAFKTYFFSRGFQLFMRFHMGIFRIENILLPARNVQGTSIFRPDVPKKIMIEFHRFPAAAWSWFSVLLHIDDFSSPNHQHVAMKNKSGCQFYAFIGWVIDTHSINSEWSWAA